MATSALLLNDTRPEGHLGCELTVRALLDGAARAGIAVRRTWPVGHPPRPEELRRSVARCRLVLVNGEGTLHHDRPAARLLLEAAATAKAAGARVVLLNAVWHDNPSLAGFLGAFDRIYVRESLSAGEAGAGAVVVPDLMLAGHRPPPRGTGQGMLVLDSVDAGASAGLARWARSHGAPFRPMVHWWAGGPRGALRSARRWVAAGGVALRRVAAGEVAAAQLVVTGRFHGACLALLAGVPFVAVPSNTHKIEGLVADVGLEPERFLCRAGPPGLARAVAAMEQWLAAGGLAGYRAAAEAYVAVARDRAARMFAEIAAVAGS